MSNSRKIGAWLLGLGSAVWFIGKQKISFGVKSVSLNGMITPTLLPLRVVIYLMNKTIGTVLIRSVNAQLVSDGNVIASISQNINRRIPSNSYIEQPIAIDVHLQDTMQALIANIRSGDVNNLSFDLIGEAIVGEQFQVPIKFQTLFTWDDIKDMIL